MGKIPLKNFVWRLIVSWVGKQLDLTIYHPHSGVQIRLFTSDNWNSQWKSLKTGSRQKGKWKQITAVGFSIEFSSHKWNILYS